MVGRMNKNFILLGLILVLFSHLVTSINSITGVPKEVSQGGDISFDIDLADGNTEKNEAYNLTCYNNSAQTQQIVSFSGTTENSPSPVDIIETCSIPSDNGNTTDAVANFSLPNLGLSILFNFSITATTASNLIISEIIIEPNVRLGKLTGVRWTVTKADTGKAVIGAKCAGDILQSIGGELQPIAGSSVGFQAIESKSLGHALTSFLPSAVTLVEGESYIIEIRCDCQPSDECFDEDGVNLTATGDASRNLDGLGTSNIEIIPWLTVTTITDKSTYVVGDTIQVCPLVTNPENRTRTSLISHTNWRCDSGSDTDTNRDILGEHTEKRAIDSNKSQTQCRDYVIPDHKTIEQGMTTCYGASDVSVVDELGNILVTYHTVSPSFNVTTDRIHPEVVWKRLTRNKYYANVSFNDWDVGKKRVHAQLNSLLNDRVTASDILNLSVKFFNGSAVPYKYSIVNHRLLKKDNGRIIETDGIFVSIYFVNTTKDEFFNVTIEFVNFEERTTLATEGINASAGIFDFFIRVPDTDEPRVTVLGRGNTGTGQTFNRDFMIRCQVEGQPSTFTEFPTFVTDRYEFTKVIDIHDAKGTYTMACSATDLQFGGKQTSARDSFQYGLPVSSAELGTGADITIITGASVIGEAIIKVEKKKYLQGEKVTAKITIKNNGQADTTNLTFFLTDKLGNIIDGGSEQLTIPFGDTKIERSIILPNDARLGDWTFNIVHKTSVDSISSEDSFEVVEKLSFFQSLTNTTKNSIIFIIVITIMVIVGLIILSTKTIFKKESDEPSQEIQPSKDVFG